jgi:ketosteroid isomerase-like protein
MRVGVVCASVTVIQTVESGEPVSKPDGADSYPPGQTATHAMPVPGLPPHSGLQRGTKRAMSEENVDAVRQACAAWERGEWDASAELFDPDLEVVYSTSAFPDAGTYRGGRVVLNAWRRWLEAWDEFRMEFVDVIEAGDHIVALNRLRGRGKESGATVDAEVGVIFDCDRGIIRRMVFCDRQEALEAAGRE